MIVSRKYRLGHALATPVAFQDHELTFLSVPR